jgi:flagellar motor component MotA
MSKGADEMTPRLHKRLFWQGGRALLAALLLAGVILSGRFAHFWDTAGFAFVFGGGIALFFMGFSLPQFGAAVRYLAGRPLRVEEASILPYLWEALGRNFWIVGVLGTIASFVLTLAKTSDGIQQVAFLLTASFRLALYGMFLAVVCAIPVLKSREYLDRLEENPPTSVDLSEHQPWTFVNAAGYVLMIAILGWTIVLPAARGFLQEQRLVSFFFDPSALLVVAGGAVVMMLFLGRTSLGTALTSGLAAIGLLGSLMGLMQTLFAFTKKSISDVASALAFVISCCFLALLGLILVGLPLADHEGRAAGRPKGLGFSRLAWYLFPLLALLFLMVTFIAVVTPIKM